MFLYPNHILSKQIAFGESVQQGRISFTGIHLQPSFSAKLDGAAPEKFPLFSKKFRSCLRPRLMRDFTVPTSRERISAISS